MNMLVFPVISGCLAVLYGIFTRAQILKLSAGTERMQSIADAIQEGAKAYMNRQYTTITIAALILAVLLFGLFYFSAKSSH